MLKVGDKVTRREWKHVMPYTVKKLWRKPPRRIGGTWGATWQVPIALVEREGWRGCTSYVRQSLMRKVTRSELADWNKEAW